MTKGTHVGVLCLVLAAGQAGCDGGGPATPTAPSRQTQQAAPAPEPSSGAYTLKPFGLHVVITETTPAGEVPLAGVTVYCDACGKDGHTWAETAADGSCRFSGDVAAGGGIWLYGNQTTIWVGKEGYQDPPAQPALPGYNGNGWRTVRVDGDTRFVTRLVRP